MLQTVKSFASIHYSIYIMLQKVVDRLKEFPEYENLNFEIINMDHVEGLPDIDETACFLGYSLEHKICTKMGKLYEGSRGDLVFFLGTPKSSNEQKGFSQFHITLFYEALEIYSNIFCLPSIDVDGIELDISLLRMQEIERIVTTSEKGFIVTECLTEVLFYSE